MGKELRLDWRAVRSVLLCIVRQGNKLCMYLSHSILQYVGFAESSLRSWTASHSHHKVRPQSVTIARVPCALERGRHQLPSGDQDRVPNLKHSYNFIKIVLCLEKRSSYIRGVIPSSLTLIMDKLLHQDIDLCIQKFPRAGDRYSTRQREK